MQPQDVDWTTFNPESWSMVVFVSNDGAGSKPASPQPTPTQSVPDEDMPQVDEDMPQVPKIPESCLLYTSPSPRDA